MLKKRFGFSSALATLCVISILGAVVPLAHAKKVLVVMSYEESYPWCGDIKAGIDSVFGGTVDVRYFYMDTKTNLAGGEQKAREAFALFQEFEPDGVIAADDNAQSMFVVPYLKEKVAAPVMFCGVNADPDAYGYPAGNVSGILERYHIRESIALAQQLEPAIQTVGFILKDSPAGKAIIKQMEKEKETYSAKPVSVKEPATLPETLAMIADMKKSCDVLFMTVWQGLPAEDGTPLTDKEVIPIVNKAFGGPTIGAVAFQVEAGVLCAVTQSGREQGRTAAKMLLSAMEGTPVDEIPVTRNRNGKRLINVETMKALGIKPRPQVLRGVELVTTK